MDRATPHVVWFKRDLRTVDHRPLAEAAACGPVLPLYVVEPDYWALPDVSRRQWQAVRVALAELAERLGALGAPLLLCIGEVVGCLDALHRTVGIARLFAHEEIGNAWTYARDRAVRRFCRERGIAFVEYPQFGVARGLRDRDAWGSLHARFVAVPRIAEPSRLVPVPGLRPDPIPDANALGLPPDGCVAPQSGARGAGLALLDGFFTRRGAGYRRAMSSPLAGANACSRLSVPLATGAVSIREVLARAVTERAAPAIPRSDVDSLIARLHWHCHFIQKLESEPEMETRALHPAHERARTPTRADDPRLLAWAEGRTGFPFLDACIRSLIATGWLNFRMRAMAVSFATYQLGLDWHVVGTRLARLFTDYEPGIHWPQVQMQSGQTGINTPRIYNPVKQGIDQDPAGTFTRCWVPELARVPTALLQTPWHMDAVTQAEAGCRIGGSYAAPLVDLTAATRAARERLGAIRRAPDYREAAERVFRRHGSRRRRLDDDDPAQARALRAARAARAGRQFTLDL